MQLSAYLWYFGGGKIKSGMIFKCILAISGILLGKKKKGYLWRCCGKGCTNWRRAIYLLFPCCFVNLISLGWVASSADIG